jgi:NTP pyrophosphatase (non-canonical NTP hydrolase)
MIEQWVAINAQEECAEVIQAISKIFRFGLQQTYPNTGETNKEHLEEEIGQLLFILEELEREWKLDRFNILLGFDKKESTLDKWKEFHKPIIVE